MSQLLCPPGVTASPGVNFLYITGEDADLSHERMIGYGGYGEVHEVVTFRYMTHSEIDCQS